MIFSKFTLLTNLLLVSAALAVPSSRLEARLARRREDAQSQFLKRVDARGLQYSSDWAGAVWEENAGTFTTVTGTFTVPTPTGADGAAAAAWVGIDGHTCTSAKLSTGVDFTINNGAASYDAWYEWYPDNSYDFTGIDINAGDVIRATVAASSTTSGQVVIENLTTGQTVRKDLTSSTPLCESDAGWIVEDPKQGGSHVPLADFGTVTFTDATASGPSGTTYTPSGATILEIEQNGQVLTSVAIDDKRVSISYE